MAGLSIEWFYNIPKERHKPFEDVVRNSTITLRQVLAVCDKWEAELDSAESKISDYDNPSWAAKQAHRNGDRSRIRKLRELLSFLQGEKHE